MPADVRADGPTQADDPLLLYFTSGTTAKPKLVRHSHRSYPVGALSTMYWLGLKPGDVHVNVSSPGWAKHAWCTFFAPWNAGATVLMVNQAPFNAKGAARRARALRRHHLLRAADRVATADPGGSHAAKVSLREVCAAGEPLNPEVINKVRRRGASRFATATARPRPRRMVANSPASR